jgi:hypothetical protein
LLIEPLVALDPNLFESKIVFESGCEVENLRGGGMLAGLLIAGDPFVQRGHVFVVTHCFITPLV